MSYAKNFGSKYGKTFLSKGISASKRINTAGKFLQNLAQNKYGQVLKKSW